MQSTFRQRLLASTIILGAASLATPAWAQDPETDPSVTTATSAADQVDLETPTSDAAVGDAIIVTGSRIARPQLEGASPVTVLNSQEVKLQGITRTEDLINSLPQVFADQGGNIANGASGTATINLRGLGSERTLVLVNGRRLLPGDPFSSAADINIIPAALVDRVDVLTGGASSVYGSDAVSGVVNFILDTDFEGARLDTQYSFYQHNNGADDRITGALNEAGFPYPTGSVADGGTFDITGVIGAGFDDGRGHVTAYAGYRKINQVLQRDRDYSACSLNDDDEADVFSCGGSLTSATGTFFTNVGTFQVGNGREFVPGATPFNFNPYNHFQRPDERYVLGAFANYEISPAIEPYLEVMFMDDKTEAQIAPSGDFGNTATLNCDNPLLSAQQRAIVCAPANIDPNGDGVIVQDEIFFGNLVGQVPIFADPDDPESDIIGFTAPTNFTGPTGDFLRGNVLTLRRNVEGGGRVDTLQHTDFRIVGGVRGELSPAWRYDAYYSFGRVNFAETYLNDFSVNRLRRALDVVADPDPDSPTFGQPVCRSSLLNSDANGFDADCVPYDIFAPGGVTPAAIAYLSTPGLQRGSNEETVAQASVTGDLGSYGLRFPWANDGIGVNVGVEYRKESLVNQPDIAFQTGDLAGQGAATLRTEGAFDVKEVFGEARIPIIEDNFIEEFVLDVGYRYSDYSSGFTTDTYKIQGELAPTPDIRFRGGYNRAVRAPNVQELFAPQRVVLNGNDDPCDGVVDNDPETVSPTATQAQCALTGLNPALYGRVPNNPAEQYNGLIGGNPNLEPEKADTYTVGVVLTPRFLPGFSATVDYFDIRVKQAVQGIGQQTIINTCLNTGDPTFCSLIHRDTRGSLWLIPPPNQGFVEDLQQNIGSFSTKGIDVGASYNTEIGSMGSLGASFVGTWLDELVTDNGVSDPYDCAGFYGANGCGTPNPEWRHKARLTWTTPSDIGVSLQWRYFGSVDQDTSSDNPTLAGDVQPSNATIDSQSYFDLATTFRVGDNYNFRVGVNNIFDKDPPIVGASACPAGVCSGNAYAQVYDVLGRYIYAGVTLDF